MPQPFEERQEIFSNISAENRALLMKVHLERWLAANLSRLTHEQVRVVEEFKSFTTPEMYKEGQDSEEIRQEIEALQKRAEAVFSRDELRQIVSERADYVPAVEN